MENGAGDVFAIDTEAMSGFAGTMSGLQRNYSANVVQRLDSDFNALRDSGLFTSGLDSIKQVAASVEEALGNIVSFFQSESSKFNGEEGSGIRDAGNYSPPFGGGDDSSGGAGWDQTENNGIIDEGVADENPANFNIDDAINGLTVAKLLEFSEYARLNSGVELITLLTDPECLKMFAELMFKFTGGTDLTVLDALNEKDLIVARAKLMSLFMKSHPGELGITALTVPVMNSLVSIISKDNNVDATALLTSLDNAELLKSNFGILVDIRTKLTDELSKIEVTEFQQTIADIYNGATDPAMPTKSLELFREYIDNVAKRNNIAVEELLFNTENISGLAGSVQELNNFLGLGEYMTKLDAGNVQKVVSTLVSG